jgi:hypothetical protein
MQFVAIVRRRVDAYTPEQFEPMLEPEAQAVRMLYTENLIRTIWSRDDVLGACFLMEVASREAVDELLKRLPLISSGMAEAQVIPLRPYRGFAPR